jgi:predicted kinase
VQELIMLCGLVASGKSTIAENYRDMDYVILSSDELREELYGDISNQGNNPELFTELYNRARARLSLGFDVVIDATNLSSKRRAQGLESILKNTKKDKIQLDRKNINVIAEIIACPYNECIDRNKSRDRKVPNGVIENMYKQWQTPMKQEGFDEIRVTYTSSYNEDTLKTLKRLEEFPQFNKNHSLTIGKHCKSWVVA